VLVWYIFPVLVSCTKKNLATLHSTALTKIREMAERQPSLNLLLFLSGFSLCPSLCLDVGALGFFVEVKNAERQNVEIQIGKLQNVDITNFLYLGHLT
jgi:hypothetical protein